MDISYYDIGIGVLLAVGGALIVFFNSKAKELRKVIFYAFLFTLLMLILAMRLSIFYAESALSSSSTFVFLLFFISIVIPWNSFGVSIVGLMHLAVYTTSFISVNHLTSIPGGEVMQSYYEGLIFITMAFFLCVLMRHKETNRDLENFVLFKEVEEKNTQMDKELKWATRVHKTIISGSLKQDSVDIAISYLPVYYIGGDYVKYDFINKETLVFIICDVTGHGVPAALLVNRFHAEFERLAKEKKSPGQLLKEMNIFIQEEFEGSDMYLSAFCGQIELNKKTLKYSNYGHPTQYIYNPEREDIKMLKSQTSFLGLPLDENVVFEEEMKIIPGDKICLYTDGVTETFGENEEEYGNERLERFIGQNREQTAEMFNTKLIEELKTFKSGNFRDDICIMTIDVKKGHSFFDFVLKSTIRSHDE